MNKKTEQQSAAAVWIPPAKLRPWAKNPRRNDKAVDKVAASITRFGFGAPIVARKTGEIIAGHTRWKAAMALQLNKVPVRYLDLDEKQAHLLALADNKLGEIAEWDEAALAGLFTDLDAADLDFAGWDKDEMDSILAAGEKAGGDDGGDARPEIQKSADLKATAPSKDEITQIRGKKILIEFSGGKDSSAACVWARRFFPDNEIEFMFVEMGADFVTLPLHLVRFAESLKAPLRILRSKQTMHEAFLAKGEWPRFMHPYCHDILHASLDACVKEHDPLKTVIMRGGRLQEKSGSGKVNKTRFLGVDRMKDYLFFQPLYFTAKGVGEKILETSGVPIWDGYSCGLQRTACRICPGQNQMGYSAIRRNYPEVWSELLWFEGRFGPGCWNDPVNNKGKGRLVDLADRGDARLEE